MAGIAGMGTPNALKPPVPNEAPQLDLSNVAQVPDVASMPTPPPDPVDDMAADFASMVSSEDDMAADFANIVADDGMATSAQEMEAEDADQRGFAETNSLFDASGLAAQLEDAPVRLKAGIVKTDKEKLQVLSEAYGDKNVKKAKDGFLIKKDNKWKKFDSDSFELINDLADMGREAIEGAGAALGGGVGAGLAGVGSVASGGAGVVAAPAAIGAGAAVGSTIGTGLADLIQTGMGIQRDPERSAIKEYAASAALGGVFGAGGALLERKLADRAANVVKSELTNTDEVIKSTIDDFKGAVDDLESAGLDLGVETSVGNIKYLPEQASKAAELAPELAAKARYLTNDPQYKRINNSLGKIASQTVEKVNSIIGKTALMADEKLGTNFLKYADDIDKAEGALIGEFRKRASDEAGEGFVVLKNAKAHVDEIANRLGYGPGKKVDPQTLINEGFASTEPEAKAFMYNFEKIWNAANNDNGRVKMKDLANAYTSVGNAAKNYWNKPDSILGQSYKDLWRSVRDDYTQAVSTLVDEGQIKSFSQKSYQEALNRFSSIKNASQDLKSLLNKKEIVSDAVADTVFTKGSKALDNLNAVKSISADDPGLWDKIRQTKLNKFLSESYDAKSGTYNVNTYYKKIMDLPKEIRSELIGGKAEENLLKAAQTYANRVQNFSVDNMQNSGEAKKSASAIVGLLTSNLKYKMDAIWTVVSSAGKNSAFAKYVANNGEEILRELPKSQRAKASKVLDKIGETYLKTSNYNRSLAELQTRSMMNEEN